MDLDKSKEYIYVVGSDNQHRIFWKNECWNYEFLAGSVIFDEQSAPDIPALEGVIGAHGLFLDQFKVDETGMGRTYSDEVKSKIKQTQAMGFQPCPKHGLTSKNDDGTCEACDNEDYYDDFKGQEG